MCVMMTAVVVMQLCACVCEGCCAAVVAVRERGGESGGGCKLRWLRPRKQLQQLRVGQKTT